MSLDLLEERNPDALALARLASLAARADPALLRALRLALLPQADVGAEADVWWSALVEARTPDSIRFFSASLEALRADIPPPLRDASLALIRAVHRTAPQPTRFEERLTDLALRGHPRAERLLARVVGALLGDPERTAWLASWALGALPRLPRSLRKTTAFWTLLFAANAAGRGTAEVPHEEAGDIDTLTAAWQEAAASIAAPKWLSLEASRKGSTLWLRVATGTDGIVVPDVDPLVIQVSAGDLNKVVGLSRAGWTPIEVGTAPELRITALDGRAYDLRAPAVTAAGGDLRDAVVGVRGENPGLGFLLRPTLLMTAASVVGARDRVSVYRLRPADGQLRLGLMADVILRDDRLPYVLLRLEEPMQGCPILPHLDLEASSQVQSWEALLPPWMTGNLAGIVSEESGSGARVLMSNRYGGSLDGITGAPLVAGGSLVGMLVRLEPGELRRRAWVATPDELEEMVKESEGPIPLRERKRSHFVLWRPAKTDPPPQVVVWSEAAGRDRTIPLRPVAGHPDLWALSFKAGGLADGKYSYWFVVPDDDPYETDRKLALVTDPTALIVDAGSDAQAPTSARIVCHGYLDESVDLGPRPAERAPELPGNDRTVIYKFAHPCPSFGEIRRLIEGRLNQLGVNAIQLPVAAGVRGLANTHYFAADPQLGSFKSLTGLIETAHFAGTRIIAETNVSYTLDSPYRHINFDDFLLQATPSGNKGASREGFGGDLLNYDRHTESYDPVTGERTSVCPASALMKAQLDRWLDLGIDGVWLPALDNTGSQHFVNELWLRAQARGAVVYGEHLAGESGPGSYPVDATWNESFKRLLRDLLSGGRPSGFSATISAIVDCRRRGFSSGVQAINYLGSHDVEGRGNERIADFLGARDGGDGLEARLKLAFTCLLTSVGVPLILAGDELGESPGGAAPGDREAPWRRRLFEHVAKLVRLRTTHPALAGDEVEMVHVDHERRTAVWRRGNLADPVSVTANFSDHPAPAYPPYIDGEWREVTEDRIVEGTDLLVESLPPWSAKVYVRARPVSRPSHTQPV